MADTSECVVPVQRAVDDLFLVRAECVDALCARDQAGDRFDFEYDIVPVICKIDNRGRNIMSVGEIKKRLLYRDFFRCADYQCAFDFFDTDMRFFKFTIRDRAHSKDLFSAYFFEWKRQACVTVTDDDNASCYAKQAEASLLKNTRNNLLLARWVNRFAPRYIKEYCRRAMYGELYIQGNTLVLHDMDASENQCIHLIYVGPRRSNIFVTINLTDQEKELYFFSALASQLLRYYAYNTNYEPANATIRAKAWFDKVYDKESDTIYETFAGISVRWCKNAPDVVVCRSSDEEMDRVISLTDHTLRLSPCKCHARS